jgi:hypothetical protein
MARVIVRFVAALLLIVPAAVGASDQNGPVQQVATWALSFDPSGLDSGGVRRIGYPAENSPASFSHRGRDGRVFEASAQTAKVTQTAEGISIELSNGRHSMTARTTQRMSAPSQFTKLLLTLDKSGEIVSVKLRD